MVEKMRRVVHEPIDLFGYVSCDATP